jgi:hypothetical protein
MTRHLSDLGRHVAGVQLPQQLAPTALVRFLGDPRPSCQVVGSRMWRKLQAFFPASSYNIQPKSG